MNDGGDDDKEGVGQVTQKPHLHRLDGGRAGEGGGDREIHRGEHHHTGDVHCHWSISGLCKVSGKSDQSEDCTHITCDQQLRSVVCLQINCGLKFEFVKYFANK